MLDRPPRAGETIEVELRYAGQAFDETEVSGGRSFHLRDTLLWYPHAGEEDLATYDVLLRWPKKWDLLAVGELEGEGTEGDLRWQRRTRGPSDPGLHVPVRPVPDASRAEAGDVDVMVAIDAVVEVASWPARRCSTPWSIPSTYLTGVFGPLPCKQLVVVTSQQDFSQSMLGFVTLSSEMTRDDIFHAAAGAQDPRATIAHEISHQWWGHQVSWRSYRDQWLSEALADYSAALYAREHLAVASGGLERPAQRLEEVPERWTPPPASPSSRWGRWCSASGSTRACPRTPIKPSSTPRERWCSTCWRSRSARRASTPCCAGWPRRRRDARSRPRTSSGSSPTPRKLDLTPFADAFVYGTGIPELEYSYQSVEALARRGGGAKRRVAIDVARTAPFRFSYRVSERADGSLDVMRDVLAANAAASPPTLAVPFEVTIRGSTDSRSRPRPSAAKKTDAARTRVGKGVLLLEGERSSVEIEVPAEPDDSLSTPTRSCSRTSST